MRYVIASSKNWFLQSEKTEEYKQLATSLITKKDDLNFTNLQKINPKYIFFPHWSWKVPSEIYNNFNCIVFHTAPLPFGRGGSPLQNLIIHGFKSSPVCALKMTDVLDGGPIYCSEEITLDGNISEIFQRLAITIERLILQICKINPVPIPQNGEIVNFKRLSITDNELLSHHNLVELYDRIRMVDGLDYQKAFINYGEFAIEFSDAKIGSDYLSARVIIKKRHI